MTPAAAEASRRDRRRNESVIRVARITNGYMVTEQVHGDNTFYSTREELLAAINQFFDQVEARHREVPDSQPPNLDHRHTSRPRGDFRANQPPMQPRRFNPAVSAGVEGQ